MKPSTCPIVLLSLSLAITSCKKGEVISVNSSADCHPVRFTEYENADPNNPNQARAYLEHTLSYEQNRLVRIDTKKRGVADGHREIRYTGTLPVEEVFFDKDSAVLLRYRFNYEPGKSLVSSIDVEYHNLTPFVQARYTYHYNAQARVDSVDLVYSGRRTGYNLYSYAPSSDGERVTVDLYQVSTSDPGWKEKYAIAEYEYDNRKSPFLWPVFSWNQFHDERLDLVPPPSTHNIKVHNYKNYNASASNPAVGLYVYDRIYPSFTASTEFNNNDYPYRYSETRMGLSTLAMYTFDYACK